MITKPVSAGALLLCVLTASAVQAQDRSLSPNPGSLEPLGLSGGTPPPVDPVAPAGLSSWITNARPCCCNPFGGDGKFPKNVDHEISVPGMGIRRTDAGRFPQLFAGA